jgi:ankyrin repeat protein
VAAERAHAAIAEWLITHGVPVHAADKQGHTALRHVVFSSGSTAVTELLLANGADVHATDSGFGRTALETAAGSGHTQCAELLIAAGADVTNRDQQGATCLHMAACNHHIQLVQLLLQHGAAAVVNTLGKWCRCCGANSVLMGCATVPLMKLLLSAGADVHMTAAGTGNTALHQAVVRRLTAPVVCMLIKAGADLHAVNNEGKTAADIAHDKGYSLIESLLLRAAQS